MKRNEKQPARPSTSSGYTFVNINLSKVDKEWLANADLAAEFPPEWLFDLVQEGFKISVNEDQKNNTYVCSITDVREKSETHKCILSGRGTTALNAWYAVAYRHFRVAETNWLPYVNNGSGLGSDFG